MLGAALGIGVTIGAATAATSVDTSSATSSAAIASTPGTSNQANSSSTANSFSSAGNLNTGTNFIAGGTLPSTNNPSVSPQQLNANIRSDLIYDRYLAAGPDLNGPGSVGWCIARSSCSDTANQCSAQCQNNILVTSNASTASSASFPNVQLTNLSSGDCVAACQAAFNSCQDMTSRICERSQ